MLFIALLVTLHTSSIRDADSQESSLMPLVVVGDLLEQALSSQQRLSYSIAHISSQKDLEILRLVLWGEQASDNAATVISYYTCHPVLMRESHRYIVQSIRLAPRPWVSLATWADLALPHTDRVLEFRFLSPMTLHDPAITECLTFPEPQTVFSQLLGRWNDLGGPALSEHLPSFLEQGGCVVADYQLHTCHLSWLHERHAGWIGWIRYYCRDLRTESIAAINSLASLANFTGIGFATAQGMGLTRRMPSKERGK